MQRHLPVVGRRKTKIIRRPGVYSVINSGVSGHNLRSNPSLYAPAIGMIHLGDSVIVTDIREEAAGDVWACLGRTSVERHCLNADGDAWTLVVSSSGTKYLQSETETEEVRICGDPQLNSPQFVSQLGLGPQPQSLPISGAPRQLLPTPRPSKSASPAPAPKPAQPQVAPTSPVTMPRRKSDLGTRHSPVHFGVLAASGSGSKRGGGHYETRSLERPVPLPRQSLPSSPSQARRGSTSGATACTAGGLLSSGSGCDVITVYPTAPAISKTAPPAAAPTAPVLDPNIAAIFIG